MKAVSVIGAGTMGRGIAQVFALRGYPVTLVDRSAEILSFALERIKERTDPEAWEGVLQRIRTTTRLDAVSGADLAIEAVPEEIGLKKKVLKEVSVLLKKGAIIATNTSSISIDSLSIAVTAPERFIGMHFMNPPKVMRLVEVVRGEKTSDETLSSIVGLVKKIDKTPTISKDSPGFISNRLLFALIGEAMRLIQAGVADKESIDTVMKAGMNHPMGPIELADFIGLDVCLEIMRTISDGLNDKRYAPPVVLENLVKEGKLGRKTGEGFYKYS
ncbi:MAG: 3-hydroxyacyl-CoA dehydrogenase family protein [Deltaproteobacteria bacterium]|nr:3-hydroxyacyl-CoA dehydrogenase family protein [Deltaproteobacteria bacterium]